jgi:hypothetical protein
MTYSARAQFPRKGRIPKSVRAEVFARDGDYCVYCDYPADVIDHVIPYCYGGTDDTTNLVASCRVCNSILSGRMFDTFADKQRWIRDHYGPDLHIRWEIHVKRLCLCAECRRIFRPHVDGATNVLCPRCNKRDLDAEYRWNVHGRLVRDDAVAYVVGQRRPR